jgi:hypothetical protein
LSKGCPFCTFPVEVSSLQQVAGAMIKIETEFS